MQKGQVIFNVELLRQYIDEWMGKDKRRNNTKLGKKVKRGKDYIRQICNRGYAREDDLYKLCKVIGADYDEITKIVSGTAMELLDDYCAYLGRQMVLEDYLKTEESEDEDEDEEIEDFEDDEELNLKPERKTCPSTMLLRPTTKKILKDAAWMRRTSFSQLVTDILEEWIQRENLN